MRIIRFSPVIFCILLSFSAVAHAVEQKLVGNTMGTIYRITLVTDTTVSLKKLQGKIDDRLTVINNSMSIHESQSEVSRFNRMPAGKTLPVSSDFLAVMQTADWIYQLSGGAWDGTVAPLIELWGFGRSTPKHTPPSPSQIQDALHTVGFHFIHISPGGALGKNREGITLNLASIAKGYGVDAVSDLLIREGFQHFLVEIGGEVYAHGLNGQKRKWRVGINRPDNHASVDAVYKVVTLSGLAMATSGDYRQFFEKDGKRYSHILDPKTGYPVTSGIVSASVIAKNCTIADGLATALMVMKPDTATALIARLPDTESLIIVRRKDGGLIDFLSDGLKGIK